ncbi:hypothetical protein QQS21_004508 [Conoideocrella luteorostrata]|uniref:Uncharacterized protein n=1 Tax=Conoideocrella luteorostrata TaxID=1105319 RepID=A0AAJ0CRD9_9HYPO|nr:hypothetical protein QQS21_004508 [Conoideocrella luteorostrata]
MQLKLLLVAIFVGISIAEVNVTASAIKMVNSAMTTLDDKLANWNGNFLGILPVLLQTDRLLKTIDNSNQEPNDGLQRLGLGFLLPKQGAAGTVIDEAQDSAENVAKIMSTVIAKKDEIKKIPFGGPIMFGILKTFETSADTMMRNVVSQAPDEGQRSLKPLQRQIQDYFPQAIAAFG